MSKICPYCGGELLTGYIQSRDGVCWSEKKKLVSALPGLAKDELYLPDGHIGKEVTALPPCFLGLYQNIHADATPSAVIFHVALMLLQKLRAVVVIVLVKLIGHQRIVNAAVIAGFLFGSSPCPA